MIQSYVIHRPGLDDRPMFDTVVDGKHVYTALVHGFLQTVPGQEFVGTHEGNETRKAVIAYAEQIANSNGVSRQSIDYIDVPTAAAAPVRIRKALAAADDKAVVIFACRGEEAFNAAAVHLNFADAPDGEH